jgi:hydrogenase maturation protein HypF
MQNHDVMIMTSANVSDRPMIYDDCEAMSRLFGIADAVLTHNRQIFRRMDDSVCSVVSGKVRMIRRARGYAPEPVRLKDNSCVILALGAQEKNTFCLAKGENAFLSGHIGDLDDMDTERCYESEIQSYMRLFDARPDVIACDMHPDYVSTRYAARFKSMLPIYEIQHHHAHFASVLAEHDVGENAIGLIFDGTGYGTDGAVWGGEALWGGIGASERIGHMRYAPLLGGEAAIREPWRMALAMLCISCGEAAALDYFDEYGDKPSLLLRAHEHGINSPMTSGAGRLFDAVAALAGIRTHTTFEGQAAIDLEQAIDDSADGSYGFDIVWEANMMIFDWRQLILDIVRDVRRGCSRGKISAKFHRAMVQLLVDVSTLAKKQYGSSTVALSGGVFQNMYLLRHGLAKLEMCGFDVYSNEKVPANDGGISYGQAAAASRLIVK